MNPNKVTEIFLKPSIIRCEAILELEEVDGDICDETDTAGSLDNCRPDHNRAHETYKNHNDLMFISNVVMEEHSDSSKRCTTLVRRKLKHEREDVQKKTFAKWVNSQLSKRRESPVTDLFYDLRDGTKLLILLEILTDTKHAREKGGMRVHRLSNVRRALDVLASHNVKLVNISADHIVDGSPKITLGLVWAIILHWQVQGVLKEVMAGLQQTSLEKTLLAWCRQSTKGYTGVDIRNFSSSWSDGLAFNALLHRHYPDLFEWVSLANKVPFARLQHAFNLASKHLGIDQLLDPEDVHTQAPDKKSVMMYVMCLFQALPPDRVSLHGLQDPSSPDASLAESASGGTGSSLPSPSSPQSPSVALRMPSQVSKDSDRPASMVTTCLVEYFRCLEEVLMWLLGAEERLSAMPDIGDTTAVLKEQFHALEAVMLELTARQSGVGEVLKDGGRLVQEGVAKGSEAEEIRRQMVLLNTRWEDLRVKAMSRQSMLHMKLMQLQQSELEALKNWLSSTEDRISAMGPVGSSLQEVQQQLEQHRALQSDLEQEQVNISSLSNMVVVVDDPATDSAYMQLEDELTALGERWSHVCKWSEHQWATLQALALHWAQLEEGVCQLTVWLDDKEKQLRQMESNPSMEQQHILAQASVLQELQCELEVQHEQLSGLQEQSSAVLSAVPPHSAAHTDIPRALENIQDRWDCLHSIIEAQKTRLAKCGIDVSTVVVMGGKVGDTYACGDQSGSNTTSSSTTTTKTAHGSTIITRVITTKSVSSQESLDPGGQSKRQKLDLGSGRVGSPGGESSIASSSPVPVEQPRPSDVTAENPRSSSASETYKSETVILTRDSCEPSDLPGVMSKLEDIEAMLLPSATLNKNDEQKEDLQRSIVRQLSALESVYRRTRGEAGGRNREQQQLVAQWLAIQNMLRRIRSESIPVNEAQITDRFALLHSQYSETRDWLDDAAIALQQPGDDEDVRSEMMNLRSSIEDGLESLQLLSRVAQERLPADTGSSLRSDIAALLHSWLSLDTKLKELENTMYAASPAPVDPDSVVEEVRTVEVIDMERSSSRKMVEKIETVVQEVLEVQVEGLESLERWLSQVEREVTAAPLLDVLPTMMSQMNTFRGYLNRVIAEADRLAGHQREMAEKMSATAATSSMDSESSSVVTDVTNNMVEVMSTVSGAADKCAAVRLLLERRLAALAEGVDALEQHHAEVKGLQSWLAEVKVFLRAEEDQVLGRADLETLRAQLLQSNALEDDIVTLSSNLTSVEQTCAKLESGSIPAEMSEVGEVSAALREEARHTAHRLRSEWDSIVSKTRQLNDKLMEAVKTKDADTAKNQWLDWACNVKVPSGSGIETTGDLQAAVKACESILEELSVKKSDVDKQLPDEACRADVDKKHRELQQQVEDRLGELQATLQDYNLFKELSAAESSWLLELEQKLLMWEQPAADAEEISAKQDELESFLRHRNEDETRARLTEVAESLVQRQVMTVAVQNCQHDIETRRKTLTDKSESVQQSMEKASVRAQESEQQYLTLLERISSLQQLSCVVHSDQHTKEDAVQIEKEIAANKESMEELRSQIEVLQTEGNQPAADRLSQQLQLLQSKLEEVLSQLRADGLLLEAQSQAALSVSSPVAPRAASAAATGVDDGQSSGGSDSATEKRASMEVTDRIAQLRAQLLATGDRAKHLSLEAAAPAHVHEKLSRCLVVYRELSEVKSSVEGTLATGRRLVKEKISTQPHTLSSKLDDLKALYNELGSDVTQRRTELEEGVHQSRKLEKEMTAANKLLTASERTLAEAAEGMDSDQQQRHIEAVKLALEELRVKRPLLTGAWESYNYLAGMAGGEGLRAAQAALEELERRWESCVARLADTQQRHEAGEEQKEGEMSEFILRLADIKAWLEGTEQKLAQDRSTSERTALLKVLSEEVVEYRSAVESIKSAGASHISHGTLFRDKLEPELRDITRRWESINTQVKHLQEQEKQLQREQKVGTSTQKGSVSSQPELTRVTSDQHVNQGLVTGSRTQTKYSFKADTVLSSPRLDSSTDVEKGSGLKIKAPAVIKGRPAKQPWNVLQSRRQFSVPKFPHKDPTSFDPNSTDHSVEGSPVRPRKRKVDKEVEADNLDDLIASLKRVAEREMKPSVFEKIKKKASSRNIPVESFLVEKLSLLNVPKRSEMDDDDLESLCSVDTDMAPASETSRDLECTYSDLESVNESVSSRDLLSTTGGVTPVPPEVYLAEASKLCPKPSHESEPENYRSEAVFKLSSSDRWSSTPVKNRKLNSAEKVLMKFDQPSKLDVLPVEKLEAMIAELDQVISDTESEDEEAIEPNFKKEPTEAESNTSDKCSETSHFTVQEVRGAGHVEFAKAEHAIEKTTKDNKLENPASVSVSSVETSESFTTRVKIVAPEYVRSRSVDSAFITNKSSNMSFIPSSETFYPVPENATLVTLLSRPTSEESLASKKYQENLSRDIDKTIAMFKSPVEELTACGTICQSTSPSVASISDTALPIKSLPSHSPQFVDSRHMGSGDFDVPVSFQLPQTNEGDNDERKSSACSDIADEMPAVVDSCSKNLKSDHSELANEFVSDFARKVIEENKILSKNSDGISTVADGLVREMAEAKTSSVMDHLDEGNYDSGVPAIHEDSPSSEDYDPLLLLEASANVAAARRVTKKSTHSATKYFAEADFSSPCVDTLSRNSSFPNKLSTDVGEKTEIRSVSVSAALESTSSDSNLPVISGPKGGEVLSCDPAVDSTAERIMDGVEVSVSHFSNEKIIEASCDKTTPPKPISKLKSRKKSLQNLSDDNRSEGSVSTTELTTIITNSSQPYVVPVKTTKTEVKQAVPRSEISMSVYAPAVARIPVLQTKKEEKLITSSSGAGMKGIHYVPFYSSDPSLSLAMLSSSSHSSPSATNVKSDAAILNVNDGRASNVRKSDTALETMTKGVHYVPFSANMPFLGAGQSVPLSPSATNVKSDAAILNVNDGRVSIVRKSDTASETLTKGVHYVPFSANMPFLDARQSVPHSPSEKYIIPKDIHYIPYVPASTSSGATKRSQASTPSRKEIKLMGSESEAPIVDNRNITLKVNAPGYNARVNQESPIVLRRESEKSFSILTSVPERSSVPVSFPQRSTDYKASEKFTSIRRFSSDASGSSAASKSKSLNSNGDDAKTTGCCGPCLSSPTQLKSSTKYSKTKEPVTDGTTERIVEKSLDVSTSGKSTSTMSGSFLIPDSLDLQPSRNSYASDSDEPDGTIHYVPFAREDLGRIIIEERQSSTMVNQQPLLTRKRIGSRIVPRTGSLPAASANVPSQTHYMPFARADWEKIRQAELANKRQSLPIVRPPDPKTIFGPSSSTTSQDFSDNFVERSYLQSLVSRVQSSSRLVGSESWRSSSNRSSLVSEADSFIESLNRQWYEAKKQQGPVDPAAILERTKRYGKVYRSSDVATLPDPHIVKRLSSQDRSSCSSSEFRWGSSSASSMVGSSDESSIDFGLENRCIPSSELFFKESGNKRMSSSTFNDVDSRMSIVSLGSFATDKNIAPEDMCLEDFDTDATEPRQLTEQSSSDESEAPDQPSKTRISAATLYEDAVSQVLENSRRRSAESTASVTDETIMETVSDSSVSMRGVMFNAYAKDKLDGIVTNPKTDSSLGKLNEIKRRSTELEGSSSCEEKGVSCSNDGTKSSKNPLNSQRLDCDILSGIPLRMRLERHVSMDSSVSTISDADTVIFNPMADLSRNNSISSSKQKNSLTREPKVMLRSVSAEGILQKPKDFISSSDPVNATPRTIVYTSVPRKKVSSTQTESTYIKSAKSAIPKFSDNPSSDSMEEQEITMDLSDSQVSEKEETTSDEAKKMSRLPLSQTKAPRTRFTVDILPYEERHRAAFVQPSVSSKSCSKKHVSSISEKLTSKSNSSSDDSGEERRPKTESSPVEVSSSLEVLHSSSEILDEPVKRRKTDNKNCSSLLPSTTGHPSLYPMTINKEVMYRASITSFDTEMSDSILLGFSETEDEIALEETSDEDLTFEEEQIKRWVEKQEKTQDQQQEAQRSTTEAVHQKTSQSSPSLVRSSTSDTRSSMTATTSTTLTSTSSKASSFRSTAHVQLISTSEEAEEVGQYLQKVTALVDKIAAVRMKAQVVPVVSQALNNAQALEQEVKALESDVASVISRGDSLVLDKDASKTSAVETAVKELRTTWAQLRAQTEVVKSESELVATELSSSSERVNAIVSWLNDFNRRLNLLDTDYSQLQALEQELVLKRSAVDDLNSTAALLTKYRHQQLLPSLAVVNSRWAEVTALLQRYRHQGGPDPSRHLHAQTSARSGLLLWTPPDICTLRSVTLDSPRHLHAQNISPSLVPDYIASVNKVRETVSSIARQVTEPRHPYHALIAQQDNVRKLQDRLTDTKDLVERVEDERSVAIKSAAGNAQQTDQVRRVTDKLREEWAQVNRSVNEQHASLAERQAAWHSLQTSLSGMTQWLADVEDRLRMSKDEPLAQAKLTQKELEKQVTLKHRVSQKVQEQSTEILDGLPAPDRAQLQQRVDGALQRWRSILSDLAARRSRIASEGGGSSQYESISAWLAQANALLQTPVNVTDESALAAHTTMVQNHVSELNTKKQLVKTLQDVQPAIVSQSQVAELQTSIDKLSQALPEYQNTLETKLNVIRNLLDGSEELYRWTEKIRLQAQTPSTVGEGALKEQEDPILVVHEMQQQLEEKSSVYETLDSTYWVLAHDAESKGLSIDSTLKVYSSGSQPFCDQVPLRGPVQSPRTTWFQRN
ncbi:Calponin domain [Trinorchestia longiramus]|nr:Calponin domain [Trinorchestia longiramus]